MWVTPGRNDRQLLLAEGAAREGRGRAVQLDSRLTRVDHAKFQRLNFKYEEPLANFVFNLNVRHYSVVYFSRALRLNWRYLSAWTLMGHEYVEMKNPAAAGGLFRTCTRPTLNRRLLLRASV